MFRSIPSLKICNLTLQTTQSSTQGLARLADIEESLLAKCDPSSKDEIEAVCNELRGLFGESTPSTASSSAQNANPSPTWADFETKSEIKKTKGPLSPRASQDLVKKDLLKNELDKKKAVLASQQQTISALTKELTRLKSNIKKARPKKVSLLKSERPKHTARVKSISPELRKGAVITALTVQLKHTKEELEALKHAQNPLVSAKSLIPIQATFFQMIDSQFKEVSNKMTSYESRLAKASATIHNLNQSKTNLLKKIEALENQTKHQAVSLFRVTSDYTKSQQKVKLLENQVKTTTERSTLQVQRITSECESAVHQLQAQFSKQYQQTQGSVSKAVLEAQRTLEAKFTILDSKLTEQLERLKTTRNFAFFRKVQMELNNAQAENHFDDNASSVDESLLSIFSCEQVSGLPNSSGLFCQHCAQTKKLISQLKSEVVELNSNRVDLENFKTTFMNFLKGFKQLEQDQQNLANLLLHFLHIDPTSVQAPRRQRKNYLFRLTQYR